MHATVATLVAFGEPLRIEDVPIGALGPGQVLVAIEAAGVCGSDVHMWRGHDPRTPLPIILGHEGVGRVVATGGRRRNLYGDEVQPGDRLLWERGVTCGECYYCAVLAEPSLCPHRWAYGIHRSSTTPPHLVGCYATHLVLDVRTHLIPLRDEDDPALLVAAACSGATAAHGFDLSPVRVGDTVVVLGPGPVGAFSVALARAGGAEQVIVVGGTGTRLDLCRALGAAVALDRSATTISQRRELVCDLTHGRGADLVVEASGSLTAMQEGLTLLRPGGTLSLLGFGAPVGQASLAPFESLVHRNVRVQGVCVSDVRHTLRALSILRRDARAFAALVTHRFPLAQATEALQAVADRAAMKAVLLPPLRLDQ